MSTLTITTQPTLRDGLVELAELAIDNPSLDTHIFGSVENLTPGCVSAAHRELWWGELKAAVEQYDLGGLTADGPEHWAARRDEALDELTGAR